jgi:hypothetical protein
MLRTSFTALALPAALATLLAWCLPAAAQTQSWDYKSYQKDPVSGGYDKTRFRTSKITVVEADGKAIFRMQSAGRGDPCINRGDLPATVERTPDTLVLTVTPELAGCEPFRYLIRTDGSGGVRQHRRGGAWVENGFDHGLTPSK